MVMRLEVDTADAWQEEVDTLARLHDDREKFCAEFLHTDIALAKASLHRVISGSAIPVQFSTNEGMRRVQRAGRFLRWLAASAMPETFAHLVEENKLTKDKWPEASLFALWWNGVEDLIVSSWAAAFEGLSPTGHYSLHFDGVRVDTAAVEQLYRLHHWPVDGCTTLCQHLEHVTLQATGYRVRIVHKEHHYLTELLDKDRQRSVEIGPQSVPDVLLQDGNCIPYGLACLTGMGDAIASILPAQGGPSQSATPEPRAYRDMEVLVDGRLEAHLDVLTTSHVVPAGDWLIHSENGGHAHCTAVRVPEEEGSVVVFGKGQWWHTTKRALAVMLVSALDARSVVLFKFDAGRSGKDTRASIALDLLDLRAAA